MIWVITASSMPAKGVIFVNGRRDLQLEGTGISLRIVEFSRKNRKDYT